MNNKNKYRIRLVEGLLQSIGLDLLLCLMWHYYIFPNIEYSFKIQIILVILLLILPLYKIYETISIYRFIKKSEKDLIKGKKKQALELEKIKYRKLLSEIKTLSETEPYETVLDYINQHLNGNHYPMNQYCDCSSLNSIIEYYKTETHSKNILFEVAILKEIQEILTKHQLNQKVMSTIIGNFMDNAIESLLTSPKSDHKISLEISYDQHLAIRVSNNGNKISNITKIFEARYSTKGENRGLGLVIVERMVDRINGTIHVKSNDDKTSFEVVV